MKKHRDLTPRERLMEACRWARYLESLWPEELSKLRPQTDRFSTKEDEEKTS